MRQPRTYYVYIMSGPSEVLYTGVTGDLEHRVYEHKHKLIPGYTTRFNINRLLYYEEFDQVHDAIAREKQIKGLLRVKKLNLIRQLNPDFEDLSKDWESL